MYTIFIFRRDLRLHDNTGLIRAMEYNDTTTLPIFIFTPEQVDKSQNKYFSLPAYTFMLESLACVDECLQKYKSKLHVFYGDNVKVLSKIIKEYDVKRIVFNQDYTPYSIERDTLINKFCNKHSIECIMEQDYLLHPIDELMKSDGTIYEVFTPYKNNALKHPTRKPNTLRPKNLTKKRFNKSHQTTLTIMKQKYKPLIDNFATGGRDNGLKKMKKIGLQKKYSDTRNIASIKTTELSPYIKFGCVSIREVMEAITSAFNKKHELISQLYWREFYTTVAFHHPSVLKGKQYSDRFNIRWRTSTKDFDAWCCGRTGYPIVDAGMAQLNQTGFQHNRLRLICSNFLNRLLGIDWRKGEQYYAQNLVDYDPAVNNGNWQWIASTGVDPKPYNQRLFNPWLQSKRFDKDCLYIKKWLPELADVPMNHIHQWDKFCNLYDIGYPNPCVDYKEARQRSLEQYKKGM